jgi:hypothetical protein
VDVDSPNEAGTKARGPGQAGPPPAARPAPKAAAGFAP